MRVLVVEDDPGLRGVLVEGLRRNGYPCAGVETGEQGLSLLATEEWGAAIVDWRLPGMEGVEVARRARRNGIAVPILMLTARDRLEDRVEGLDAGADDYLVKPFAFPELLARLRALLRRPTDVSEPVLSRGAVRHDPSTRETTVGGHEVALTPRETAILELLLLRAPRIVSRDAIAGHAWDLGEEPSWNAIEAHVARLRAKLAGGGVRIQAVRGSGYRLTEG